MRIDKDDIKIILILLVVCLGMGYAYINSDLNINGTANINSANWDVHWSNIQVTTGSVSGSNVVTQPTISNGTTVTYSVILSIPGDYYEFTVDAVNGGAIDAMIDSMEFKVNGVTATNTPEYLNYSVTYSDGTPLAENHELKANTTETYRIRVEYNTDIELDQIPAANQTILLSFGTVYRQATPASIPVDHVITVYTISTTPSYIGQAIPNDVIQYTSAADAMAAFSNRPFYLKHLIRNGIIEESYVEFVVTATMANNNTGMTAGTYTLRGFVTYDENSNLQNHCKAEYYDTSTNLCMNPYYESNKPILQTAFGSSNCTEYTSYGYKYYSCIASGFGAYATSFGLVHADDGGWLCGAGHSNQSNCGY